MTQVIIPDKLSEILQQLEGKTLDQKLAQLIERDLEHRLRYCSRRIVDFEVKYGLLFEEFRAAWELGTIPDRHAHEIERDYMEWESLVDERQLLLTKLKQLTNRLFS
ncbi:MAG TPA: hypothetical protein ENI60_09180 [Candidatus Fraserbacteria bacterium]|nr:hypothetical protein [Candidatus Fraserbacteria bacterium]